MTGAEAAVAVDRSRSEVVGLAAGRDRSGVAELAVVGIAVE